jgi:CDP-glucose 4,6-dehydratase
VVIITYFRNYINYHEKHFGDFVSDIFSTAYLNRKVMVTGHTGFKGSWLCSWLHMMGAEVMGVSLSPDTEPNHFDLLSLPVKSAIIDIRDAKSVRDTFSSFKPEIVFHLAAQPLVRKSYVDPALTYETNVIGTLHVYEACRQTPEVKAIVSITTDKVYENREWPWGYRESDALGGHDPYSSSKACAEILSESYRKSFFEADTSANKILLSTVRAGNVIGGGDWSEDRLIPDSVKSAAKGETTLIRNPHSIRPWQHVLEPLYAYLLIGQKLLENDVSAATSWNIGPLHERDWTVGEIMNECSEIWSSITWTSENRDAHPVLHEAGTLKLDCSKAVHYLDWAPVWDTRKALEKTIHWYKNFYEAGKVSTFEDIEEYIRNMRQESPVPLKLVSNA